MTAVADPRGRPQHALGKTIGENNWTFSVIRLHGIIGGSGRGTIATQAPLGLFSFIFM